MRKIPIFLFVLILFFHGCSSTPESIRLAAIDSLVMADERDSAYAEILRMNPHFSNAEDKAHYQLLLARTSYMTDNTLDSDSTIDGAISYYEKNTDWEKLTDAYYYKAACLYERKKYAEAIRYYKKAEETAQKTDNIHQKYKIAESLVRINHVGGNYKLQLDYARKALGYALESNNKNYIATSYFNLSQAFQFLRNVDSVCVYTRELIPRLDDIYPEQRPDFLCCIGYMYFNENKLDSAKLYYQKSLDLLKHSNTLENLADVYMKEGNQQKAYELWKEAFLTNDENTKEISMFNMLQCDLDKNRNLEDACERLYRIYAIKDSISNTLTDRTILEMQQQYDEEVSRQLYENKIMRWMIAALLLGMLLLIGVGYAKYRQYRTRQVMVKNQMLINQYNHEIINLNSQYDNARQIIRQYESVIHNYQNHIRQLEITGGNNEKRMEELNRQLERYMLIHQEMEDLCKDTENQKETLRLKMKDIIENGSPKLSHGQVLYDDIMKNKKIVNWKETDYQCFAYYYEALYFTKYESMVSKYRNLTTYDIFYLILRDMGKNNKEIAQILGIGENSIRSVKYRVNKKLKKKTSSNNIHIPDGHS